MKLLKMMQGMILNLNKLDRPIRSQLKDFQFQVEAQNGGPKLGKTNKSSSCAKLELILP